MNHPSKIPFQNMEDDRDFSMDSGSMKTDSEMFPDDFEEYSLDEYNSPKLKPTLPKPKIPYPDRKKDWPIYLGSFVYDSYTKQNFLSNKSITVETSPLRASPGGYFFVKWNSTSIICDGTNFALSHANAAIWYFLLNFGLIQLFPFPLSKNQIKIEVFLTERASQKGLGVRDILDTISFENILFRTKVSDKTKRAVSNAAARLCKESLLILLDLLKVKKTLDPLISVKDRIKSFQRYQNLKFGKEGTYPRLFCESSRWDYYVPDTVYEDFTKNNQYSIFASTLLNQYTNSSRSRFDNDDIDDFMKDDKNEGKKNDFANYTDSGKFLPYEQPAKMTTDLHEYQRQALSWLLYRENSLSQNELLKSKEENQGLISNINGFLEVYELLDGKDLHLNIITGQVYLDYQLERFCKGGILADEMGLGKTLMMLGLIQTPIQKKGNKIEEEKVQFEKIETELRKEFSKQESQLDHISIPDTEEHFTVEVT